MVPVCTVPTTLSPPMLSSRKAMAAMPTTRVTRNTRDGLEADATNPLNAWTPESRDVR